MMKGILDMQGASRISRLSEGPAAFIKRVGIAALGPLLMSVFCLTIPALQAEPYHGGAAGGKPQRS